MATGITVFFPCFNDEKSIGKLVIDAFNILKKITKNYEVIVIDDGSTDDSRQILKELAKKYPVKLIFHDKNVGYGGALRSGFKAATKELVFYTDGDGQYNVNELPVLFNLMQGEINFVNGIKMARHDPTYRIVLGSIYSFITRWSFWLPLHDIDCDFRLIKKAIIDNINLKSNSGAICIELAKKSQLAGAKFRQVSVNHFERKFGNSQFFRPKRLFLTFLEITKLWIDLMVLRNKVTSDKK